MKKNENIFNGLLKPALQAAFGAIVFLNIFFILYLFQDFTKNLAQEQLTKTATLTAQSIRFYLDGAKNELLATSRRPDMLKFKTEGVLTQKIARLPYKIELLLTAYEVELADFLKLIYDLNSTFIYLKNIPPAFNRLVIGILTMDLEGDSLDTNADGDEPFEEYKLPPDILFTIKSHVIGQSQLAAQSLAGLTQFIDHLSLFKQSALSDSELTNLLLATSLDTGHIKGIAIKNLEGQELASADLSGISLNSSKDSKAIAKGKNAFDGGVVCGALGKAYWWFGLPIRNINREPVACLSALIDLSKILQVVELEEKLMRTTLIDGSGECIFSHKKAVAAASKENTWNRKTLSLAEGVNGVYPDLQIIVELDVYKYLNHYYYECILSLLVIFLAGCYFLFRGVLSIKNLYNSEVRSV